MDGASNQILQTMVQRLYASLVHGPSLSCRPHSSRQRIDLSALAAFKHISPSDILPKILGSSGKAEIQAKVPLFESDLEDHLLTEPQRAAKLALEVQQKLLRKLREIAEDAGDYEKETGENAFYIGYPILSIPPGADELGETTSRVLAPIALIPVDMIVKRGATQSITLTSKGSGIDLVIPNFPLLAWLEQQTGRDTSNLFADEQGSDPWREIHEIAKLLAEGLKLPSPPAFSGETTLELIPRPEQLPKTPTFLNSAVLGLFPISNPGLLRDMKAMAAGEILAGPVQNFLSARNTPPSETPVPQPKSRRAFNEERLVSTADPCQARAVHLAKEGPTLVIHGPPGTGKSQTITNIIGDHLSRGERVLLVCDKRTALDVVQNRLEHLGLGQFCAVVHDPQRDQRNLYMKIRDQLETLAERKTDDTAEPRLREIDDQLQAIHKELSEYFHALSDPLTPHRQNFHDLVGAWFSIDPPKEFLLAPAAHAEATVADFNAAEPALREIFKRGAESKYPNNPWRLAAGISSADFVSQPAAQLRQRLNSLESSASALDKIPSQPPLGPGDLLEQAAHREKLADTLNALTALNMNASAQAWFAKGPAVIRQTLDELSSLASKATALDPELNATIGAKPPTIAEINTSLDTLCRYQSIATKWYSFLFAGRKSAAQNIATPYGLAISPDSATRLTAFLSALKFHLLLKDFLQRNFQSDQLEPHRQLLTRLLTLHEKPEPFIASALASPNESAKTLQISAQRARSLAAFLTDVHNTQLFAEPWIAEQDTAFRTGSPAAPVIAGLIAAFDTLDTILRLNVALENIPASLKPATTTLLHQSAETESGLLFLKKTLLAQEISGRIHSSPALQQLDQARVDRLFQQYRQLESDKRNFVRESLIHQWVARQKSRLLAATGAQLNSDGAALKRRLLTRGERAMKLRQMILSGAQGPQPDPIFDICPVWMASPGTVAQIFPRQPVFDAIIFDEASQCRLEEALPVLVRGRRIVIAGDPKQLPPTRFFETALIDTETEDAETEQALFEQQQGDTEDLLAAALNIETQQCYLDVHYRSRNEALIGFSNQNFYGDRLQPIPGHPSRRAAKPPIHLIRAEGIYEKRGNPREAAIVCDIIAELLARPEPPSIGVACFNLTQRDLILDTLDERAEQNAEFAERLKIARERRGAGSFEGLFVKNLENVQGDERDHMIISCTFGPDPAGKFRRNFGPIGQAGGGRRLNVLVTRAREMVHLITSIPRAEYAALPKLENNQLPGGRWLLYTYLHYAENLARAYETAPQPITKPQTTIHNTPQTSAVAASLAKNLAHEHAIPCDVPWGNAGFCVDIAMRHPKQPADVTIGILCDMTRFQNAADPVEWDIFRTGILEDQGWSLYRVWSPALYTDPDRQKRRIAELAVQK